MKPGKSSQPPALCLDTVNQCLWQGTHSVTLTPKAFLVLRYLMDRPGQLATKEELLKAAWPEVYVSDAALKVCIRRLRRTLGDESRVPRFIETIPWRGYRFIGAINKMLPQPGNESAIPHLKFKVHGPKCKIQSAKTKGQKPKTKENSQFSVSKSHSALPLVGRDIVLSQIHSLLLPLLRGKQQTVFLSGEPGIGKTAVVDALLTRVSADARFWVVSGQCIEHYGAGEPYLPILEALERLCRLPGNEQLISILRQHAPMWLVQMPSLISSVDRKRLRQTLQGTTPDRMLREFAEALTRLTTEKPLILIIEDLHWIDLATLNLLSFLTRRHHQSRLLFLGTYRPDFIVESDHPLPRLIRELSTHGQCHTIPLGFLDEEAVLTYVTACFPSSAFLPALAQALYQRTDGNPLFIVNVIEYLIAQGSLRQEHGQWRLHAKIADIHTIIPTNVQQLIDMQLDRLSPDELQILEVASVAGIEFSAAAVAAAIALPIPTVEEQYTKLARRSHFLRSLGAREWPDGTVAQQYAFIHSLYQNILYQRIPAGKRAHLHLRIGQQQKHDYRGQAEEITVELAMHFERGRDFRRAVQYRHDAAEKALQRYAYREAIEHFMIGLELLKVVPDSAERVQQEIALCSALGTALTATEGYASIVVEQIYARAHTLWQQAGSVYQPFPILLGLWGFANVRAELPTALTLGHQLLDLASTTQDSLHLSLAHNALGATFFWQGNLIAAQQHYEHSLALNDPTPIASTDFVDNPGVVVLSSLSVIFSHFGNIAQARTYADKALTLAQEQEHHYSLALARCHVAALHQVSRDFLATQRMAAAGMAVSAEKGFPYCLAFSTIQHGWARAMLTDGREGIEQVSQGVTAYQATGAVVWQAYFLALLAEVQLVAGQITDCLQTLTKGITLAQARGQLLPEADLYRIKGEVLLLSEVQGPESKEEGLNFKRSKSKITDPRPPTPDPVSEAEVCFLKSIEIGRTQQAKALELRATLRLCRLWQQQGKGDLARQTLRLLYERFSAGQNTADFREAQALLISLSA